MNALWLERITTYKNTSLALHTAKVIISHKIAHQNALLKKYHQPLFSDNAVVGSVNGLLLYEARAAKHFWKYYRALIPTWANFSGRKARAKDVTNVLLDIGYHHLANEVKKILETHNVTLAPALLHVAHKEKSAPLVYDLMELFRSDLVDNEVLKYLRLKKKPLAAIGENDIRHFVHLLNKRFVRKYFLRDFDQCHTYRYYLDLQIAKFIKAVNHKEVFVPLHLPQRHDTRCTCTDDKAVLQ